jgi:hypothetical protein
MLLLGWGACAPAALLLLWLLQPLVLLVLCWCPALGYSAFAAHAYPNASMNHVRCSPAPLSHPPALQAGSCRGWAPL